MTEEESRIFSGKVFDPSRPVLRAIKQKTHDLNLLYNTLAEEETERRRELLLEMLGEFGEGSFIQGPLYFHYGKHTRIGKRFFGNFNLTIQDDAAVSIGDDCSFGPNVTIVTPLHPMLPEERRALYDLDGTPRSMCYAKPVTIGRDCWLGANVVVCPGVTIGDGCVIGAGSVVIRDVPANCFAAGNPCRVIRRLGPDDSIIHRPEILAEYSISEPGQKTAPQ